MRYRIISNCLAAWQLGTLLILSGASFGQETSVEFDPRETGQLDLNFKTVLLGLIMALGCVAVWRFLIRQLERSR